MTNAQNLLILRFPMRREDQLALRPLARLAATARQGKSDLPQPPNSPLATSHCP